MNPNLDELEPVRRVLGNQFLPRIPVDPSWEGQDLDSGPAGNMFDATLITVMSAAWASPHRDAFNEAFKNRVVVDLACGDQPATAARQFNLLQARGYIGVDLFNCSKMLRDLGSFPAAVIRCDALAYLKTLESGSCNVMVNAFDLCVREGFQFHIDLAREMMRVCAPGGVILGLSSDSLKELKNILDKDKNPEWIVMGTELVEHGGVFLRRAI